MRKIAYAALPIAFGALILAGCSPPDGRSGGGGTHNRAESSASNSTTTSAPATEATAPQNGADDVTAARDVEGVTPPPTLQPPATPIMAYDYRYGLALPSRQVRPLMDAHQEACERAGPTQCQVVGVNLRDTEEDEASGELTMRATPAWMRLFRDRLEGDARDLGGRLLSGNTSGEDVAPVIEATETQEQLLRDRRSEVMRQLSRADAKTQDGLREELANIEAQIASVRDQRQTTEGRAAMATMVVTYQANGLVPATGDAAPLAQSFRHFWRNTAQVAAVLVEIASVLAPFVILGVPIWWLIARSRRRHPAPPPPSGAQQTGP